jgi:GH18 family chitinase
MDQASQCTEAMFYAFNVYDEVDDDEKVHRISACTAYGSDWKDEPKAQAMMAASTVEEEVDVSFEVNYGEDNVGTVYYASLIRQMRNYIANGHGNFNKTTMLYSQFGSTSAGLYLGQGLQHQSIIPALEDLEEDARTNGYGRDSMTVQLCGPDSDSDHIFGFTALSNATFETIQEAMRSWMYVDCLDLDDARNLTASVTYTLPLLSSIKGTNSTNSTTSANTNATVSDPRSLRKRGECRTTDVVSGDSCASLAQRCGISGNDITKYNSREGFCSTLRPGQHVCCSAGDLPDYRPKPNEDGTCATHKVADGENCDALSVAYTVDMDEIEEWNKNTWAWRGCDNVLREAIICLSEGDPPMPPVDPGAVCGPQMPNTKRPDDMSKIGELNPCPLNACCDVWGQCGTTAEFCTDTSTGAPGSAKPNTNGCISNCGTTIVRSDKPAEFRSIGYYEGFSFNRECLYQDVSQIDTDKYTHLHFGFGDISHDYQVSVGGDLRQQWQFEQFKYIRGVKRILSFGGWAFSTEPATYTILREGTKAANRLQLAKNIAQFAHDNYLDGVDIDWEYPAAPDIPGIPAGDKEEGDNYLAFLVILKNLLKGKSLSIAAPASFWYLKGFPIEKISKVVDYIVFMTYDLHGQWDAGNAHSIPGCPSGQCLRSQVNLTETINSLVMVTKAGVPSNKVIVGVTSYGRSFKMAQPGCYDANCLYTGSRLHSDAMKGNCTATAGYIANAEIVNIINEQPHRVTQKFHDKSSDSDILVYDDTEWVGYMTPELRSKRVNIYKNLNMGGSVLWATDLEAYNDSPNLKLSWKQVLFEVDSGNDPLRHSGDRHNGWNEKDCSDPYYRETPDYTPKERWDGLEAGSAWSDMVQDWRDYQDEPAKDGKDKLSFSEFIAYLVGKPDGGGCEEMSDSNSCSSTTTCRAIDQNPDNGPAAVLIWNSLVRIRNTFEAYHDALQSAAAFKIDNSLGDFINKFAPEPPKQDDKWLGIFFSLLGIGLPFGAGKFFTNVIGKLPGLVGSSAADKAKDISTNLLSGGIAVANNLKGAGDPAGWDKGKQLEFGTFVGNALDDWDNIGNKTLQALFKGDDDSIDRLTKVIADGHFANGIKTADDSPASDDDKSHVKDHIVSAFYAFALPALWRASGHWTFVMDTGEDCSEDKDFTTICYDGRLYKLTKAEKNSGKFTKAPQGADNLKDGAWGDITPKKLVEG